MIKYIVKTLTKMFHVEHLSHKRQENLRQEARIAAIKNGYKREEILSSCF